MPEPSSHFVVFSPREWNIIVGIIKSTKPKGVKAKERTILKSEAKKLDLEMKLRRLEKEREKKNGTTL